MTGLYITEPYPGYNAQCEQWPFTIRWETQTASTTAVQIWNDTWTTAQTTGTYYPQWNAWIAANSGLHTVRQRSWQVVEPEPETPKQRWERERKAAIWQRRREVQKLRERVAARRAERLLMENLDHEQLVQWLGEEAFDVKAPSGRMYRIRRGVAGNVYRTRDSAGRTSRRRYCCHINTQLAPVADNVLTQKLLLETNEEEFLRLANVA